MEEVAFLRFLEIHVPGAQPHSEAIDLYNSLIQLPYDQVEEIGRLEFRLRGMRARSAKDSEVAVAHLTALLKLGRREEAVELAEIIWGTRFSLSSQASHTFAACLMDLGRYERATALVGKPEDGSGPDDLRLSIAFASGDVGALRALAARMDPHSNLRRLLERFDAEGLSPHFADHQRVVNEIVGDWQVGRSIFGVAAEGIPEWADYVFVSGDKAFRRALTDRVDDALEGFYKRTPGLKPGAFLPYVTTLVLDVRGHSGFLTARG